MDNEIYEMRENGQGVKQDIWSWWFAPRRKRQAWFKIPIAVLLIVLIASSFFGGVRQFITVIWVNPIFMGVLLWFLFLPILIIAFCGTIFWVGLFLGPYLILEQGEKDGKALLKFIVIWLLIGCVLMTSWLFIGRLVGLVS